MYQPKVTVKTAAEVKAILGKDLAADPKQEFEVHAAQMRSLRTDIAGKYPNLQVELLLMALDGKAVPVA